MDIEFDKLLSDAINQSKKTQIQIAKELGVSPAFLSNIKNGKKKPNIDLLRKICIVLDVSADYLLGLRSI